MWEAMKLSEVRPGAPPRRPEGTPIQPEAILGAPEVSLVGKIGKLWLLAAGMEKDQVKKQPIHPPYGVLLFLGWGERQGKGLSVYNVIFFIMEVENIGHPVILEDLKVICEDGRRNSISVIPQEKEPTVSHIRRHSIAQVPQEIESKGGDIINNSIPVIQQAIEPNGDEIGRKSIPVIPQEIVLDSDDSRIPMIPQEVESKDDESDDINTDSIPVIPQEMESNVDESNDVIPVTAQEMELEGSDVGRNSIPETMQEIELDGDDIQANSIPVILHEMDSGDLRRNSIACIPQEMEPEGGDIRRNSIIVTPAGIEANVADVRRRSIARSIQSRYLRASMGSCHDYCKYGKDENLEASPKAERKRTSTTNSNPSPDSFVTEKRVISVTKKGTPLKKVSSLKEVHVPMEDSIHSRVQRRQFEPSSMVKSMASHEHSPDSEVQILNKSFVTEKNVVLVTEKRNVSLEIKTDVTLEDSMDLEEEQPELSEPSSLAGSVHSMMNYKLVSRNRSKPSQDSETRKLNDSAVMEKKAISVKKKDTGSLKNEMSSFVSMVEQGSHHKGNIGTRKSKEAADSSSTGGNRSIRNHTLSGEKQTMGMQIVSLSSKHFNKRDSNVNPGSSYNHKGFSHVKDQNHPGKVEPDPPSDKDLPEKILYVIESSTENNTVDSTPDGVSVPKPSPLSPVSVEGKSKNNSLERARKRIGRIGSFPSFEKKHLKHVNVAHSLPAAPLDQDNKGLRCTRHGTQESLSPSLTSSSMSISSPWYKLNGANSQHGTSKTVEPIGKSKVQHKTTPRKSAIVGSGNQNSVSRKLSFRRGRVIELQPENITPRRLKFRRASSALEVQNSEDSITSGSIGKKDVDDSESTGAGIIKRGSNVRKEVDNRQSNAAGIIKKVSIVRKEVDDHQSNGVAIKREIIGKKKVDDQTNGAGIKRVSILKKELVDCQPNGAKEVDDNQTNGAKLKSVKVRLRNQEQVEVSPRKILRRKGNSVGLSNGIRSNSEKVVLRHQDVKGKKDQKLLNNVIEETASKLVETRKSKVKALVGAFETVISLQDTRPAAKAAAC
ncbi:hypothetical protein ACLB2K_049542 [Fragaria x ananassa]